MMVSKHGARLERSRDSVKVRDLHVDKKKHRPREFKGRSRVPVVPISFAIRRDGRRGADLCREYLHATH